MKNYKNQLVMVELFVIYRNSESRQLDKLVRLEMAILEASIAVWPSNCAEFTVQQRRYSPADCSHFSPVWEILLAVEQLLQGEDCKMPAT